MWEDKAWFDIVAIRRDTFDDCYEFKVCTLNPILNSLAIVDDKLLVPDSSSSTSLTPFLVHVIEV